jgi:hypothetical protein
MTSASRLRGRDTELTVIGSHLDRLLSGVGTVVVLEGPAGMGKSRLLAEVAVLGQRLDMLVGRGVADPGDTIVQLAPLMEALFEGPGPILDRDALTEVHTSPEQRYWLLQDIEAALERGRARVAGPHMPRRPPVGRRRHRRRLANSAVATFRGAGRLDHRHQTWVRIAEDPKRDRSARA